MRVFDIVKMYNYIWSVIVFCNAVKQDSAKSRSLSSLPDAISEEEAELDIRPKAKTILPCRADAGGTLTTAEGRRGSRKGIVRRDTPRASEHAAFRFERGAW